MKGAAASVGLKRIQQIAAQAQNPEVKNWESNIGDWIAQIEQVWQQDVAELFNWLDSQTQ